MTASFVDLRKKSGEIIKALNRREQITILYRGKTVAIMQPVDRRGVALRDQTGKAHIKAKDHPAFGMWANRDDLKDVAGHVRRLRRSRVDAI